MNWYMLAWMVLIFLSGALVGTTLIVRKSHKELKIIRAQRDKLTADTLAFQQELRNSQLAQMTLCTENVRALYQARQEDATRYTKALNACLQLVSEVLVSTANIEAFCKHTGGVPAVVASEIAATRTLCTEMRNILSSVSFEELGRIVAALSESENLEVELYNQISNRQQENNHE